MKFTLRHVIQCHLFNQPCKLYYCSRSMRNNLSISYRKALAIMIITSPVSTYIGSYMKLTCVIKANVVVLQNGIKNVLGQ